MTEREAYEAALEWLRAEHARIMDVEQSAIARLGQEDITGYREGLRQKALLVADLAARAHRELDRIAGLTEAQKNRIVLALEPFSASAENGLALNSPFYMSALLYPDDHKPGQPDNLWLCIERLAGENG